MQDPFDQQFQELRQRLERLRTQAGTGPGNGTNGLTRDLDEAQRRLDELGRAIAGVRWSAARLQAILDTAFNGMFTLDDQYRVGAFNPAAERMFGYQAAEVVGRNVTLLLPSFEQEVQLGPPQTDGPHNSPLALHCETVGQRRDGTRFPVDLALSEVSLDGHHFFTVIVRDITDHQQAMARLRSSEARCRRLIDSNLIGILVSQLDGKLLEANDAFLEMIGYPREELRAGRLHWHELTPEEHRPRLEQALQEIRVTGVCAPFEKEYHRKDGSRVPVLFGAALLEEDPPRCVAFVLDLSDRRQMEQALRASEVRFRSLVEVAECLIIITRPDFSIRYFSPFAETVTGYQAHEVGGQDYCRLLLIDDDHRARWRRETERVLAGEQACGFDLAVGRKDGTSRWVVWKAQLLADYEGEPAILAVGLDISDLKAAQERALQAERLAAIGEMVAGLAHESGNALQRSQAGLERLALRLRDRPQALELLADIQQAQDHLYALYEEARGYAAPIRLELRLCHLADVWREAWAHLEGRRQGRQAVLSEQSGELGNNWWADPFRLEQVFRNILANALDACRDPVAIDIRCQHVDLEDRRALRVTVHDNGPGLNAEQRQRIFEPFYTTKTRGTGLGMAIARRIVEAHGGQLAVGTAEGPGTEIQITLPARNS